MQALNHVAFGTLIAITIKEPALVVPLALASHFALDMLPHYGEDPRLPQGSPAYHYRILADALASLLFVAAVCSHIPNLAGVIGVGAFFALLPDFFWPAALYAKQNNPIWKFLRFHKRIQKFESPRGIYVEVVWFAGVVSLIVLSHARGL